MSEKDNKNIQPDASVDVNLEERLANAVNKMDQEFHDDGLEDLGELEDVSSVKETEAAACKDRKSARPQGSSMKQLNLHDFNAVPSEEMEEETEEDDFELFTDEMLEEEEIPEEETFSDAPVVENEEKAEDVSVKGEEASEEEVVLEEEQEEPVSVSSEQPEETSEQAQMEESKTDTETIAAPLSDSGNQTEGEAVSEATAEPPKKKGKAKKIAGLVAGMVLAVAAGAYAGVSYYYTDKFFEGTTINGIDCSGMTASEVEKLITEKVEDYSITIKARNVEPEVIKGSDLSYKYRSNGDIANFIKNQKCYLWPKGYFEPLIYTAGENITFDQKSLEEKLMELECAKDENQVDPVSAHILYENGSFSIIPENEGSSLILPRAYRELESAVSNSQMELDFNNTTAYEPALIKKDDPTLVESLESYNKYANASITYLFDDKTEVLDGNIIKDWLTPNSDGVMVKDDEVFREKVVEYVADLGRKYDTVGKPRTFTATTGRQVTVYAVEYGWSIDEAAEVEEVLSEIEAGEVVEREPIYAMMANSHDDSDVGNTYIEVDMGIQHMYYYMDGQIVFDADFISGLPDGVHATPEGIYLLYGKESPSVLIGDMVNGKPEYVTPVSYWMPFNGGIGFHDATWQYMGFGGALYTSLGSHGCINLSLDSAAALYSIIRFGDPIVCFY